MRFPSLNGGSNKRGVFAARGGLVIALFAVCSFSWAQPLPAVSGRTFNLPTSTNHRLFIPDGFDLTGNDVDLLVHFHGDPATVNNNAGYAGLNAVVLNVNYSGFSSAYSGPFGNTDLFGDILSGALSTLRAQPDIPNSVELDQLSLSAFSAGYGAVREILKQPSYYNQIDGLLLADSLYASFTSPSDPTPLHAQLQDFKAFALDAANNQKTMVVSHSQVQTYTYANTAETADALMQHVGVRPTPANEPGLGTLDFYRKAEKGNFSVWGATGSSAASHSRHLQYMAQWLGDLPFDSVPVPPTDRIVTLADFEVDEGTFDYSPLYSGSNFGIQTATADRVVGEAHLGSGSQRISVTHDTSSPDWMLRHTSGGAFPSNNVAIDPEGYIGFWLKTATPGVTVQLGLDNPDSADVSTETAVIADGLWHLYEWNLDDPGQWQAWATGDGIIDGASFTIDAVFLRGSSDAVVYLDEVAYNNGGSLMPVSLAGDYNGNGEVDAADYTIWADNFNAAVNPFESADGNGDGIIDAADYTVWADNFGSSISGIATSSIAVPEPSMAALALLGLTFASRRRGRDLGLAA